MGIFISKPIDHPLRQYLSKYLTIEPYKSYGKTEWKQWLRDYKEWSKILEIFTYCQLNRLGNRTTQCVAEELLDAQINDAQWDGNQDREAMLTRIKTNLATIIADFEAMGASCSGDLRTGIPYPYSADLRNDIYKETYHLAYKISLHGSDIAKYAVLPKLEHVNLRRNKITSFTT